MALTWTPIPVGQYYTNFEVGGVTIDPSYAYDCVAWVNHRIHDLIHSEFHALDIYSEIYKGGDEPKAGAIAVWKPTDLVKGHVAFVEASGVFSNGGSYYKESGEWMGLWVTNSLWCGRGSRPDWYIYPSDLVDGGGDTPVTPDVPQTQYGDGGTVYLKSVYVRYHGSTTQTGDTGKWYGPNLQLWVNGDKVKEGEGGPSDEEKGVLKWTSTESMGTKTSNFYVLAQWPYNFNSLYWNESLMEGITYYKYTADGPGDKMVRWWNGEKWTSWKVER